MANLSVSKIINIFLFNLTFSYNAGALHGVFLLGALGIQEGLTVPLLKMFWGYIVKFHGYLCRHTEITKVWIVCHPNYGLLIKTFSSTRITGASIFFYMMMVGVGGSE